MSVQKYGNESSGLRRRSSLRIVMPCTEDETCSSGHFEIMIVQEVCRLLAIRGCGIVFMDGLPAFMSVHPAPFSGEGMPTTSTKALQPRLRAARQPGRQSSSPTTPRFPCWLTHKRLCSAEISTASSSFAPLPWKESLTANAHSTGLSR